MDNPSSDFEELFACLNARGVRALVVGSHALAFHGRPRYTKDLDVLVEPTPANAIRLLEALTDFGFGSLGLSSADFTNPDHVVQLGVAPNRVDLMTAIQGVTFAQAWAGRAAGMFGRTPCFYLGRTEFLESKRASGRLQDLADIEALGA